MRNAVWQSVLKFGKRLVNQLQKFQQHEEDIKKLQQADKAKDERIERLTSAVQRLAFELEQDRNLSVRDRENLVLRLENTLLRSERGLPSGEPKSETETERLWRLVASLQQEVEVLKKQIEQPKE